MHDGNLAPDSTLLALIRALVAANRAQGMPAAESRRKILDELRNALPEEAVGERTFEQVSASWRQAVDAALDEPP